jgi:hypothetical protein
MKYAGTAKRGARIRPPMSRGKAISHPMLMMLHRE